MRLLVGHSPLVSKRCLLYKVYLLLNMSRKLNFGVQGMAPTNREERLQVMLGPEELRAIDDFRYAFRLPTRAAAVRELLHRGLQAAAKGDVREGSQSKDFGVLGTANGSGFDGDGADGSDR